MSNQNEQHICNFYLTTADEKREIKNLLLANVSQTQFKSHGTMVLYLL